MVVVVVMCYVINVTFVFTFLIVVSCVSPPPLLPCLKFIVARDPLSPPRDVGRPASALDMKFESSPGPDMLVRPLPPPRNSTFLLPDPVTALIICTYRSHLPKSDTPPPDFSI